MALTTYTELQAAIASWLLRTDLTAAIPDFIRLCEADLQRNEIVRRQTSVELTADAAVLTLPSDFKIPTDLFHNGPDHFGQLEIGAPAELPAARALYGSTGVPRFAAFLADAGQLLLAPTPDGDYPLTLVYDQGIVRLATASGGVNWLLTAHPDIYLYGALMQSAPYLEHDERLATWEARYGYALAQLERLHVKQDSGANTLRQRTRRVIG